MSAEEQDTKNKEEENNNQPEEEEKEEPLDPEIQKQMKNLSIDKSVFSNQTKNNHKKEKKENKSNKKNKGQDFLDYANKNNIEINIQYEKDSNKFNNYDNNKKKEAKKNNYYNKNYNKSGKYNNNNNKNYKNNENKKNFQKKKIGGNKFDDINMFNKNMMFQNNNYKTYSAPPILKDDKDILNYLEEMFGEQNLNKDLYLRYRLGESGLIKIDDIVKYRNLANNNVSAEKILELIKDNKNFEKIELEGKTYLRINNFKEMKLLTIDEINNNKKSKKNNQFPYNNYYGYFINNYLYFPPFFNQQQYENQNSP